MVAGNDVTIVAGPASARLAAAVCGLLGTRPAACDIRRFPDGETQVELGESVRGDDMYLIQATGPPVNQHLIDLLLMADACRRAGARRLTGIIPYFGYARQDRRAGRRSLGARVAADAISAGRFDRLVLIDAHTAAIEGFFSVPIEHLTAVPLLAKAAAAGLPAKSVIVAPDLGAVKLAREYAKLLHLPLAVVHKTRLDGEAVEAKTVIGDVAGHAPIIVDDMLSTGGTIEAAVGALRNAGAVDPVTVSVTHGLLVGRAVETIRRTRVERLLATDSLERGDTDDVPLVEVSLAPLLAEAVRNLNRNESLLNSRYPA